MVLSARGYQYNVGARKKPLARRRTDLGREGLDLSRQLVNRRGGGRDIALLHGNGAGQGQGREPGNGESGEEGGLHRAYAQVLGDECG